MFKIVITEINMVEGKKNDYRKVRDIPDELKKKSDFYGDNHTKDKLQEYEYVMIDTKEKVERTIYTQEVDTLSLKAVINAING